MSYSQTLPSWFLGALEALRAGDVDGWMAMYAADAVHEFPFAPQGSIRRLEGRAASAAYMRQIPARIRFGDLSDVRVRTAGDELIVEAVGHHRSLPDDAPRTLGYVWFITHRDGRVSLLRDYMAPL